MSDRGRYAAGTTVTPDRSMAEVRATLRRYGADSVGFAESSTHAMVAFTMRDRHVRLALPLPDPASAKYTRTPQGRMRTNAAAFAEWERDVRQRWRALALVVKADLEAVASGIVSFEEKFGMSFVLPDNATVAQHVLPRVAAAYATGDVPALLPPFGPRALPPGDNNG